MKTLKSIKGVIKQARKDYTGHDFEQAFDNLLISRLTTYMEDIVKEVTDVCRQEYIRIANLPLKDRPNAAQEAINIKELQQERASKLLGDL